MVARVSKPRTKKVLVCLPFCLGNAIATIYASNQKLGRINLVAALDIIPSQVDQLKLPKNKKFIDFAQAITLAKLSTLDIEPVLLDQLNWLSEHLDGYVHGTTELSRLEPWIQGVQVSEWQKQVMKVMVKIPKGKVKTYGELSKTLKGSTSHSRAVGLACGRNPLPLIYPCHRVVGFSGKLTGFGFGLENKASLLKAEGVTL